MEKEPHWINQTGAEMYAEMKSDLECKFFLYRHFDRDGNLLYVGVSWSVLERLRRHEKCSPWFGEVDSIRLEKYPSRKELLKAELEAIRTERPLYNKAHAITSKKTTLKRIAQELYEIQMEKEYQLWLKEQEQEEINPKLGWREEFIQNYNRDFPSPDGEYHSVSVT